MYYLLAQTLLAIAGVFVVWIYSSSSQKKQQSKLNLLRYAMERDVTLDVDLLNKVSSNRWATDNNRKPLPPGQGLRVAGIIIIAFGVGVAFFGGFISLVAASALYPMVGIGALFCCFGTGFIVASRFVRSEGGTADPKV